MDDKPTEKFDVVIVGMGPVGAAIANLLGKSGLSTLVIEKSLEIYAAPRAIALDNEALRILQMCGLEEGELDTVPIPEVRMLSPRFGMFARSITTGSLNGHPRLVTFFQPQLEALLRKRAAQFPCVEIRTGVELVDFSEVGDGVRLTLSRGNAEFDHVHCKYLVGADGANSFVRRHLRLGFEGKTYTEDWLVVDAKRVSQPIGHIEFYCDPGRPSPRMIAPGGRQRWEFKLKPTEDRQEMERPERVYELLRPWIGESNPEIERVAVYRFHARVVDRFRVGRAFLAGDAAHITPPFVGQGLVSGLRDAANLAWKLERAVAGQAGEQLLDSYDLERRPHVKAMVSLARFMGALVMPRNRMTAWLTHSAILLANRVPRLRQAFERQEMKPTQRFRSGCFESMKGRAHLVAGSPFPQTWLRSQRTSKVLLSDDFLGNGFSIVGFGIDPTVDLPREMLEWWRSIGAKFLQIDPSPGLDQSRADDLCLDITGLLIPAIVPIGWLTILRPDRVVLMEGSAGRAEHLLQAARACLSR